jgi:hypothetical protein
MNSLRNYLEQAGFFYEYGVNKSLVVLLFYAGTAIFIARNDLKKAVTLPERTSVIVIALLAISFAYYYFSLIELSDRTYFYPSTTNLRIDNILVLSILFGITSSIYFVFYKTIFGNSKQFLTYTSTICLMTSPLQLWSLYSSATRDYLRAAILTIIFTLIVAIIKGTIKLNLRSIYIISAVMAICMTFRQEIWLYFLLLFCAVLIFTKESLKSRMLIVVKMVLIIAPAVLYLTSSHQQVDSALGRLIPGLSEDIVRLYFQEPVIYVGPFADLTAPLYLNSNIDLIASMGLMPAAHEAINLSIEHLLRLPQLFLRIIELPLSASMYPQFFSVTLLGSTLEQLRSILANYQIYILSLIIITWYCRNNYKLLIYLVLAAAYITLVCSLQFLTKNIFHLELLSYLALALIIDYLRTLLVYLQRKYDARRSILQP